jgi:hypothetical protein
MWFFSSMAADDAKPGDASNEVVIKAFGSRQEAELAASRLEANGIACRIAGDDCGAMLPSLSQALGVRVLISASDAVAARVLLELPTAPLPETAYTGSADSAPAPFSKISFGQILIGIILGALGMWALQGGVPPKSASARTTHYHYAKNGMVDEEWLYKNSQLVCHMTDRNLDGSFDHWSYYDDDGNISRSEEDNNFDGKVDEIWKYSNGVIVSMEKDNDFNGVMDEFVTYRFRIPQQIDIKPNGSAFTTLREFLSNGVVTEIWYGGDSNGNFREKVAYDPFFNPVETNAQFHLLSVP